MSTDTRARETQCRHQSRELALVRSANSGARESTMQTVHGARDRTCADAIARKLLHKCRVQTAELERGLIFLF